MNHIDRYVHEVGRHLPRRQRADVTAELRSSILDTLEDRYQGDPSEAEVMAMLEEFGRPQKMAASYRPSDNYLIGPELYPTFRMVLVIVIAALFLSLVVTNVIRGVFEPGVPADLFERLVQFAGQAVQAFLSAAGSVVLVFAILQRLELKPEAHEVKWDPRSLPDVKEGDVMGRGEAIAGIAFGLIFFVLINLFKEKIGLVISFGDEPLLNHILLDNLVWLNVVLLLGAVIHGVLLWQGRWTIATRLAKAAVDLVWIFIIYQMVTMLAADKTLLVEAGLNEPVPTILVRIGQFLVAAKSIGFLANLGKWLARSLKGSVVSYQLPGKGAGE